MPRFWLIFDIGLSTSFENLFAWLDDNDADECGDNAATFSSNKSVQTIVKELTAACQNGGGSRLYLVRRNVQGHGYVDRFIVGRRKAAPWSGFGSSSSPDEKDEG
jgi:hypothetical protein